MFRYLDRRMECYCHWNTVTIQVPKLRDSTCTAAFAEDNDPAATIDVLVRLGNETSTVAGLHKRCCNRHNSGSNGTGSTNHKDRVG